VTGKTKNRKLILRKIYWWASGYPFSNIFAEKENEDFVDVLLTSALLFLFSENCKQTGF